MNVKDILERLRNSSFFFILLFKVVPPSLDSTHTESNVIERFNICTTQEQWKCFLSEQETEALFQ